MLFAKSTVRCAGSESVPHTHSFSLNTDRAPGHGAYSLIFTLNSANDGSAARHTPALSALGHEPLCERYYCICPTSVLSYIEQAYMCFDSAQYLGRCGHICEGSTQRGGQILTRSWRGKLCPGCLGRTAQRGKKRQGLFQEIITY